VSQGRDFERHRTYLWGVGYRMLGDPAEAEDVVQAERAVGLAALVDQGRDQLG
jgi:hypothetical protein